MKKIIVRADDLGFTEGVNYGIEKACRDGIIRSVGIMTNMPATKHGYDLVKDLPLCFGLHTNICAGKPLSDPKLIPSICDEKGNLKSSKKLLKDIYIITTMRESRPKQNGCPL